ncbi:unnamed protein product [Rhodiola kirilowii]
MATTLRSPALSSSSSCLQDRRLRLLPSTSSSLLFNRTTSSPHFPQIRASAAGGFSSSLDTGAITELDAVSAFSQIVPDTVIFDDFEKFPPTAATVSSSLLLGICSLPDTIFRNAVEMALGDSACYGLENPEARLSCFTNKALVNVGGELAKMVPGRVSTEVDARLAYDTQGIVSKACVCTVPCLGEEGQSIEADLGKSDESALCLQAEDATDDFISQDEDFVRRLDSVKGASKRLSSQKLSLARDFVGRTQKPFKVVRRKDSKEKVVVKSQRRKKMAELDRLKKSYLEELGKSNRTSQVSDPERLPDVVSLGVDEEARNLTLRKEAEEKENKKGGRGFLPNVFGVGDKRQLAGGRYNPAVHTLVKLYDNVGVPPERVLYKIPSTWQGIEASRLLESEGIQTHLTFVYSFAQAAAAAQAGASVIQIFVGRLRDWARHHSGDPEVDAAISKGEDPGLALAIKSYNYIHKNGYKSKLMAAAVRNKQDLFSLLGVDYIIAPLKVLQSLKESITTPDEKFSFVRRLSPKTAKTYNFTPEELIKWDQRSLAAAMGPASVDLLTSGLEGYVNQIKRTEDLFEKIWPPPNV